MKSVHRIKTVARLHVSLVLLFTLLPNVSVATPTPIYSPIFLGELRKIRTRLNNTDSTFNQINDDLVRLLSQANSYNTVVEKIEKAVIADVQSNIDWADKNKPNVAYQTQLEKLKKDLKTAEIKSDVALRATEDNFFNNPAALKNMSEVYGKNNKYYKEEILLKEKPFCPTASAATVVGKANPTYVELQGESCQTVYNAIAYKEQVNNILADKNRIIDDATSNTLNGIIKLPSKTIGDHNARQTALETVKLLRKAAENDNDIRAYNAETEVEIAQHVRKYASSAILTGPPKSASIGLGVNLAKTALDLAVGKLISETAPYNQ